MAMRLMVGVKWYYTITSLTRVPVSVRALHNAC
jgi:hypothetical protein